MQMGVDGFLLMWWGAGARCAQGKGKEEQERRSPTTHAGCLLAREKENRALDRDLGREGSPPGEDEKAVAIERKMLQD